MKFFQVWAKFLVW